MFKNQGDFVVEIKYIFFSSITGYPISPKVTGVTTNHGKKFNFFSMKNFYLGQSLIMTLNVE